VTSTSRRAFLRESARVVLAGSAAMAAGSALLGCGRSGRSGSLPSDVQIVQRFPQILTTGQLRMPISLASNGGLLATAGDIATPLELTARIFRMDGERDELLIENLIAPRHDKDLATPYWPFRVTINEPGLYRLVLDGGPSDGAAFQVFDRSEVQVPGIGDPLPPFDTPTLDDARGVNPLCTRQPEPCPLHEITLGEALALNTPIAYLVGTPAHCATGTCAPALEALVAARSQRKNAYTFIHAEVYADQNATRVAPAVDAVFMKYEPALFVTDNKGIVTARLDAVFDEIELLSVLN
jgi:hypothetical protein